MIPDQEIIVKPKQVDYGALPVVIKFSPPRHGEY